MTAEANGYINFWNTLFNIFILIVLTVILIGFFVKTRRTSQEDQLKLLAVDDLCMALKYAVIGKPYK